MFNLDPEVWSLKIKTVLTVCACLVIQLNIPHPVVVLLRRLSAETLNPAEINKVIEFFLKKREKRKNPQNGLGTEHRTAALHVSAEHGASTGHEVPLLPSSRIKPCPNSESGRR